MVKITDYDIDEMIEILQTQTSTLKEDIEECTEKCERTAVLKRHSTLEKTIKLLYSLKEYK